MALGEINIQDYLNKVCTLIKNKRVHPEIKEELKCHLEEVAKTHESNDVSKNIAMQLALKDLGNPSVLGEKLNKVHKSKIDFKLIICSIILLLFGFLSAYSFEKSFPLDYFINKPLVWHGIDIPSGVFVVRDSVFVILGIILLIILSFIDFRKIKKLYIPFYFIPIILCILLYLYPNRAPELSSYPAFILGPINFYILPIVPLMFLCSICGIYVKFNWNKKLNSYIMFIIGLFPLFFTFYVTKSFTMLLYYSIALSIIMYLSSKNKKLTIIASIIEVIFIISNFHQSMIFNSSWKFNSINKILSISKFIGSSNTERIDLGQAYPITNIIYNYGWLIGAIIILALLYFLWRILRVSYSVKNIYGKTLSFSISITLVVETLWVILMNLNMLPFMPISTAFISTGGESIVLNLVLVGILINIYKGRTLK